MKIAFSILLVILAVQCNNNLFLAPYVAGEVQYVTNMDIPRFMGQWYTIANKPNIIEAKCHCSRTFDTLLDDTTIELAETCWIFGKIQFVIIIQEEKQHQNQRLLFKNQTVETGLTLTTLLKPIIGSSNLILITNGLSSGNQVEKVNNFILFKFRLLDTFQKQDFRC